MYHPESDHARSVEDYAFTFERTHKKKIELISLESREGSDIARLYDLVRYPAVLAVRQNGQLLKDWQGDNLPLMAEVAAYGD